MKKVILGLFVLGFLNSCTVIKTKPTSKVAKASKLTYKVLMQTTAGNMTIQLYEDVPLHANNFLKLVNDGFYNGLLFHRVIPNFMIQGGDPESLNASPGVGLGNGSNGYTIPAEFNVAKYAHTKGALAAARTSNPEKASSGCQFYIVEGKTYTDAELDNFEKSKGIKYNFLQRKTYKELGGTPHLDNEYTVYGQVIDGMDVINKISSVSRSSGDRPNLDVKIIKATMIK